MPKTITEAEFHRLIAVTGNSRTGRRNRAAMWLMYGCGARVGETVALSPRDIRRTGPGAPSLHVRRGKGSRDRVVAIPAAAFDALEGWVAVRPQSRWLLSTLDGGRIWTRYLRAALARYSHRAQVYLPDDANGDKPVHPHALRHSYATRLLDEGVNVAQVQQLLGHSDLSTTAVYLGVNPERTLDDAGRRSTAQSTRATRLPVWNGSRGAGAQARRGRMSEGTHPSTSGPVSMEEAPNAGSSQRRRVPARPASSPSC